MKSKRSSFITRDKPRDRPIEINRARPLHVTTDSIIERRFPAASYGLDIDDIDPKALEIVLTLQDAGYKAYIVGGGVRDLLLGKHPKDFDVATNAHPEDVKNLFKNCRLIGRRFRLAHVYFKYHIIEVATFRGDHTQAEHDETGSSSEHGLILRDNVFGTMEEDAIRRDFSINALYYDPVSEEIIDFTGGLSDLQNRKLKLIGDPLKRFQEDPIRLLRAARFVGKLGLSVDESTHQALINSSQMLAHVSPARLFDEHMKFFLHGHAKEVFDALASFGLLKYLFPLVENIFSKEGEPARAMINQALLNTDLRVLEDKPINPAFLLAVFLWQPMNVLKKNYESNLHSIYEAYLRAVNDVLSKQVENLAIPKRLTQTVREIWQLQHLLERRRPRQILTLLHHKRFRAAYDFLLLRVIAGEVDSELADWWTEIQELEISKQKQWIRDLNQGPHNHKEDQPVLDQPVLNQVTLSEPRSHSSESASSASPAATSSNHSLWNQLNQLAQKHRGLILKHLFSDDSERFSKFSLQGPELFLDYSKNKVTEEIMSVLIELAHDLDLSEKIEQLFSGACVNNTEARPALHMACRALPEDGYECMDQILAEQKKMQKFITQVHSGKWRGATGEKIKNIVNLGIGGSDLGPHMITEALRDYSLGHCELYFISNIDGAALDLIFKKLNPAETLFILASKSFSTQETLQNGLTAREWIIKNLGEGSTDKHFIAITSKPKLAKEFGINPKSCFEMWDFVGGRYSLWSAIGLPIALSIGYENFLKLLSGARAMDQHFKDADFENNIPVILGLLGIFYRNILNYETHAVLPYDDRLYFLPSYLQQLDMESNGKRVNKEGQLLDLKTGPVIWGGVGTNGQHAFHQLLHQGTSVVPTDFILIKNPYHDLKNHHEILLSHGLAQMQALMRGKTEAEAMAELVSAGMDPDQARILAPHKAIPGNKPSNAIILNQLTPEALGSLIAMYEHKVFVQSVIWSINPFDQWGVELGKQLAGNLLSALTDSNKNLDDFNFDSSTRGLIDQLLR